MEDVFLSEKYFELLSLSQSQTHLKHPVDIVLPLLYNLTFINSFFAPASDRFLHSIAGKTWSSLSVLSCDECYGGAEGG
jgi:hypothetical protein